MIQCKTSQQSVAELQEREVSDTCRTDSLKVETQETVDTLPKDTATPSLTPRQLQLQRIDEKLKFFQSLEPKQNINLKYPGKLLRKGDSGILVIPVKQKLRLLGLLDEDSLTIHFDSAMESAIKKFQQMHNITSDGLPGKNTFRFLVWPIDKYIQTLEVNRSRIAKEPDSLPHTRIEINIPEYQLRFYQNDTLTRSFKIIVGKYKNQTPRLISKIDYLVINPCWTVPHSIATKKILPRLKMDSLFLDNRNMFVTQNGKRVNHHKIDFSAYSKTNFPYKIFQNASPRNAMGQVKFMFDNPYSVYLHDTPSKYLFRKDFRTFSSGCIRVNQAMELAGLILKTDQNNANIDIMLAKGYPVKVYLNQSVYIVINYRTARYNAELDIMQFFDDCYGLD